MADLQHASLPEALLHEAKGAAGASAGQVLTGTGTGTATFQDLPQSNLVVEDTLVDASYADQLLANEGDTARIVFSGTSFNSPNGHMSMGANGIITINTDGVYHVSIQAEAGRTTNAGFVTLGFSSRKNGVQENPTTLMSIDDSTAASSARVSGSSLAEFKAGDEISYFQARVAGGNTGEAGITTQAITIPAWQDVASSRVVVTKLGVA